MPFDNQNAPIDLGLQPDNAEHSFLPPFFYMTYGKRIFDIVLVVLSLPIVLTVIALMALFVSLDGHSPFYFQKRIGLSGKVFRIIKIRTMVHDADAMLEENLAKDSALAAEWATTQKLKNDTRITVIGRLLRKTSLDELPQLFNVLNGSMSLVGPRPMMPCQEKLYPGSSYYRMRPGITGFWQISDRNNCQFRDRAKYDTKYEQSMSLFTDFKVLLRTVSVVLRGTGY